MLTTDSQTPSGETGGTALKLVCAEVWGGNRPIQTPVELPGMRGALFSRPCQGGRGGDVHYLSVCGSGLLSRACLADVVGHGETVAAISAEMHRRLRRSMNEVDQRKVLSTLNARLVQLGLKAMTTAAAITYYTPANTLWVSYAGHPPGWYYSREQGEWKRLTLDRVDGAALADAPLAVDRSMTYTRRKLRASDGDRVLLVTDGVLEAPAANGEQFGEDRLQSALADNASRDCGEIGEAILAALKTHTGDPGLSHDDVSFLVAEFVPGPKGPPIWHAVKSRLFPRRGNSREARFASLMSAVALA